MCVCVLSVPIAAMSLYKLQWVLAEIRKGACLTQAGHLKLSPDNGCFLRLSNGLVVSLWRIWLWCVIVLGLERLGEALLG